MDARELRAAISEKESADDAAHFIVDQLESGEINLRVLIVLALDHCFHDFDVSDAVAEPELLERCQDLYDGGEA